ncbi:leucyl aminopeptidase family protein [Cereibacter azotoformans]|uniref:Leucyl aminopeptidase n=1 Tax=Cereibacter azotoformans TaxID=43057 RepID=A0A2T5JU79_9RHOB|nr:leucyl aminopeptidase family protein [Cereibacter azotoformans]AXQ92367.1 leucyl aminopeptidase family protein [Cereibacter sphaeroides]MBO4170067.1 leucyl aminopeptidase family protein [Cereibacter azotoformans]PTR13712.1 leucyl aminopeptidase [Cereibacter azotoformans]UIJ30636.1 leucyl aminopeptidase family protein [Cereibacter azotoformans]
MSLAFADPAAASRPVHVVASDAFAAWLAARPEPVRMWLSETGFEAGLGEVRLLPAPDGTIAAAVLGSGTARARARSRFGLARGLSALPAGDWHLEGDLSPEAADEAVLGWLLSTYAFTRYRSSSTPPKARLKLPEGCDGARLLAMAEAEMLTRDLINTPASDLGPQELEAAFLALGDRFGAESVVIRGDRLLERNLPMIHAVGRASPREPRLMELRWGERGPRVTLVGKGVCFDTGGLDIKPSAGMLLMKKDMGGAATVMGLAQMIMALDLPVRLRVLVPAVENAISGTAMRPRDILTSRKGLTVEVNNTDAEGRLILADALALADEEEADLIVSMATLTGAARVAVGPDLAPFYTDDDGLAAALQAAAGPACDPVWRLPFWDPYEPLIEPGIADLDNAPSGGFAGSITAALFLRRFVENPRYMHFDIYGHTPSDAPARPKGGVGQGARAILTALPQMLGL